MKLSSGDRIFFTIDGEQYASTIKAVVCDVAGAEPNTKLPWRELWIVQTTHDRFVLRDRTRAMSTIPASPGVPAVRRYVTLDIRWCIAVTADELAQKLNPAIAVEAKALRELTGFAAKGSSLVVAP